MRQRRHRRSWGSWYVAGHSSRRRLWKRRKGSAKTLQIVGSNASRGDFILILRSGLEASIGEDWERGETIITQFSGELQNFSFDNDSLCKNLSFLSFSVGFELASIHFGAQSGRTVGRRECRVFGRSLRRNQRLVEVFVPQWRSGLCENLARPLRCKLDAMKTAKLAKRLSHR